MRRSSDNPRKERNSASKCMSSAIRYVPVYDAMDSSCLGKEGSLAESKVPRSAGVVRTQSVQ